MIKYMSEIFYDQARKIRECLSVCHSKSNFLEEYEYSCVLKNQKLENKKNY